MSPGGGFPDGFDPRATALLVVDIQNDFVHPAGWAGRRGPLPDGFSSAIGRINALVEGARAAGSPIAYVRTLHGPDHDLPNYRARYAARGMSGDILCLAGTWGADFDGRLQAPRPGDLLVTKSSYDAFARTPLEAQLRAAGVETVVVCGVVTNLCVQTTLQHAFSLGFFTILAEDACAAATPAEHDGAVDLCRRFFGPAVGAQLLLDAWRAVPALNSA